jgi:hypothetical protein
MILKTIARILIAACAALLSSCIDGREEYWLRADGGGRAEITYILPAAAASVHGGESGIREMIAAFLRDTPQITASSCEVATEGNRVRVKISVAFDSALAMKDALSGAAIKSLPSAASLLAGEVTADLHGQTLDFTRKINPSKAIPGAAFLPASQFEGHRLTYIMHLPDVPTESNATRTEDAGRTLIWDIPLARAVKSPPVTRFKILVPIPWRLVSAVAVPLSLACGFILFRIRKSKNRNETPQPGFPGGNPA